MHSHNSFIELQRSEKQPIINTVLHVLLIWLICQTKKKRMSRLSLWLKKSQIKKAERCEDFRFFKVNKLPNKMHNLS